MERNLRYLRINRAIKTVQIRVFKALGLVPTGADKGLNLQMLLEHLEEEFDLPAISVGPADGGRSEAKVVGQKLNLPLVIFVPDYRSA